MSKPKLNETSLMRYVRRHIWAIIIALLAIECLLFLLGKFA